MSNKKQTKTSAVEYISMVNQLAEGNNTDKPKQQTAVEFLEQQIIRFHNWKLSPIYDENCVDEIELDKFIKQAKAMEKEQMIEFADNYVDNCVIPNENMAIPTIKDVPQYYKETYEQ